MARCYVDSEDKINCFYIKILYVTMYKRQYLQDGSTVGSTINYPQSRLRLREALDLELTDIDDPVDATEAERSRFCGGGERDGEREVGGERDLDLELYRRRGGETGRDDRGGSDRYSLSLSLSLSLSRSLE